MDFSSCTNAQIFFYGDSGEYGTQNSFTGGISTTATANLISLVRDGSGEDILRDAPERSTLTIKCQIRNALYEGATGDFTVTTTSSGGVDLNVVTGSGETITPAGFNNQAPIITPLSLIAGDATDLKLEFVISNPIPADGKIFLEVPDTFTNAAGVSIASSINIDGTFDVTTTTSTAAVYDNTMKTSGGSWLIEIARKNDGAAVAKDVTVTLVVSQVTNMQFEGASGEFIMIKTTLADGVTAIDESSAEADSIGLNGPSVTIVPSGWSGVAPTVVPL
ncbi:hypothetical protein ScalyP_jg8836, partial [Parmales sp. scaly parma]